jgi:hypothetical protein
MLLFLRGESLSHAGTGGYNTTSSAALYRDHFWNGKSTHGFLGPPGAEQIAQQRIAAGGGFWSCRRPASHHRADLDRAASCSCRSLARKRDPLVRRNGEGGVESRPIETVKLVYLPGSPSPDLPGTEGPAQIWRRGWDSNPRRRCRLAGFQDRCLKPLGHPSGARFQVPMEIPAAAQAARFCVRRRVPRCRAVSPGTAWHGNATVPTGGLPDRRACGNFDRGIRAMDTFP